MLPQWSTGKKLIWAENPLAEMNGLDSEHRLSSYINTA
jgi:hypothetical protein